MYHATKKNLIALIISVVVSWTLVLAVIFCAVWLFTGCITQETTIQGQGNKSEKGGHEVLRSPKLETRK